MATKGMSLRAQARMRRELRETAARLHTALYGGGNATTIATIRLAEGVESAVLTADRLGFSSVLQQTYDGNGTLRILAVKRNA